MARPAPTLQDLVGYLRQGDVETAARLYSRFGEDVGYVLVQKLPADRSLRLRIAKMFFLAKDFEKAALVFEHSGEPAKAARLYERADDYGMAAEMYAQVEDWPKAAQMYEKHGAYATAAELYQRIGDLARAAANFEKAVNHFRAGKTYYELGKYEKAVELLQRIGPDDPTYVEATLLVQRVIARQGYLGIAIRKLRNLLEERGLSDETLPVGLELARLLAETGEAAEAREWIERLLEVRFPYPEATRLLEELDALAASASSEAARPAEPLGEEEPEEPEELEVLEVLESWEPERPVLALDESFEALRHARLFEELSLQELRRFWELVEPVEVASGEVLIEQDVPGTGLWVIATGEVLVERVLPDGATERLAELGPGAHLGEMSLLDDQPTSARVTALTDVAAYRMPKEAFHRLIATDDRLARKIYQAFAATLMERLRATNSQFDAVKERQRARERELADLFGLRET